MLDHLREGDIIVVWKLDRLARSTRDLLETMETIREAEDRFQSISEPWADTTSHSGKMIMTIFAGIAEFERDLIRERTGAGAKRQRNEASDLDGRESLLWIRMNWPSALFRKGNPSERLRRFLMSNQQRSIDWPRSGTTGTANSGAASSGRSSRFTSNTKGKRMAVQAL